MCTNEASTAMGRTMMAQSSGFRKASGKGKLPLEQLARKLADQSGITPAAKVVSKTPVYAAASSARRTGSSSVKQVRKVAQPTGGGGLAGGRNFFGG